jgi:hypothetical protein
LQYISPIVFVATYSGRPIPTKAANMVQTVISPEVLAYRPPDPPLKEFTPARDRAFFADPEKKSLLSQASAVDELTPYIGTELKGVQLSSLTDAQKDELALLVAEVRPYTSVSLQLLTYGVAWRRVLPRPRYYT